MTPDKKSMSDFLNVIENEEGKPEKAPLNLRLFFIFVLTANMLVNVDHGCIPACTLTLKEDLHLDNFSLGILGSVVYLGLLIGSFIAPPTFHNMPAKSILLICMLANAASLILFTITHNFFLLCMTRFAVGFF